MLGRNSDEGTCGVSVCLCVCVCVWEGVGVCVCVCGRVAVLACVTDMFAHLFVCLFCSVFIFFPFSCYYMT